MSGLSSGIMAVALADVASAQTPRLPGIGGLGSSFDLLSADRDGIESAIGNLFVMDYTKTTEDGKYMIPEGVLAGEDPECDRDILTQSWMSQHEYDSTKNDGIIIGGDFGRFSGSYSHQTKHVHNKLSKNTSTIAASRTQCRVYTVTLLPGYAELNPLFLEAIDMLPDTYYKDTEDVYHAFLETWQTHVLTRCRLGGVMEQITATNKIYRHKHSEDELENEIKASFIISIDKTHSHDVVVDDEFEHDTSFEGVEAHGGQMQPDDQWATWAQSVQQLQSPACVDWSAVEMPDVLLPPWSPEGLPQAAKVSALRAAVAEWFFRPGCTDVTALNFNESALTNDTSCVFPPPEDCDKKVQKCFDRCEDNYKGKVTKKGTDAENCAKGCADVSGGKVIDHGKYCPGVSIYSRIDVCRDECDEASEGGNKKRIKQCQFGCGYWSNATATPPPLVV